jgi:hypothetical protein
MISLKVVNVMKLVSPKLALKHRERWWKCVRGEKEK